MHLFFQTSFGIPAEGVYTGLVIILLVLIVILLVIIYYLAAHNVKLAEDNRHITSDAIKGFQDVISALNAIRLQIQEGDNALMGKINDKQRHDNEASTRLYEKINKVRDEITHHLQYLRDKSK